MPSHQDQPRPFFKTGLCRPCRSPAVIGVSSLHRTIYWNHLQKKCSSSHEGYVRCSSTLEIFCSLLGLRWPSLSPFHRPFFSSLLPTSEDALCIEACPAAAFACTDRRQRTCFAPPLNSEDSPAVPKVYCLKAVPQTNNGNSCPTYSGIWVTISGQ